MRIWITIDLAVALALVVPARALTLVEAGKAAATIVCATAATDSERMAANEVTDYLQRVSGAEFLVHREDQVPAKGNRVFVGPTALARRAGLTPDKLGAEEWLIRTVGSDLVTSGGRPRGTIYGAYHFLEDVLGVHWWNPFQESVPRRKTVRLVDSTCGASPCFNTVI